MRLSLTAIAIVMLLGCKSRDEHRSPAKREDAQVAAPEHDAMTAGAVTADAMTADVMTADAMTADPRYLIVQIRCILEPRRPELAAIAARDVVLAIPERGVVTFERELDKSIDQRLVVFGRGWAVAADAMVEADVIVWCLRRGVTLIGHSRISAALGHVARGGDSTGEDGYLPQVEARFLEITSTPPADALRGVPDSVGAQEDKEFSWSTLRSPRRR